MCFFSCKPCSALPYWTYHFLSFSVCQFSLGFTTIYLSQVVSGTSCNHIRLSWYFSLTPRLKGRCQIFNSTFFKSDKGESISRKNGSLNTENITGTKSLLERFFFNCISLFYFLFYEKWSVTKMSICYIIDTTYFVHRLRFHWLQTLEPVHLACKDSKGCEKCPSCWRGCVT